MNTPSAGLSALKSILDDHLKDGKPPFTIEEFHQHLNRFTFRPLPRKLTALSITAALDRWPDLKEAVKEKLVNDITQRWHDFEPEQKEKPAPAPESEATQSETKAPVQPAEVTTIVQSAPEKVAPAPKAPALTIEPKRDWFDLITDFVALFFKPLYASKK